MFRSGLTAVLGMLAAWGLGLVCGVLASNVYAAHYYPGDPDPVYFDIGFVVLCVWLGVGAAGSIAVIALYVRNRRRASQ